MKNLCAVTAMLVVFLGLVPATGVASPSPDVRDTIRAALETRAQALNPNVDLSKLDVSYDLGHSQGQAVVGAQLLAYEHDKIREFHQWAAARGIRLVDVAVSLNFHDVSITTNTARVQVDESIRIDWVYTSKPGEVTTTGLGTTHDMELVLVENRWLIRRDNYKDPFRESLGPDHLRADTHGQATPVPSEFSNTAAGQGGVSIMSSATYSRTAAAAYADKYCGLATGCGNSQTYNGAKYAQASDDCTNFVSQALGDPTEGGGAPQDSRRTYMTDWYYDYPTKTGSRAWVRADSSSAISTATPKAARTTRGTCSCLGTIVP